MYKIGEVEKYIYSLRENGPIVIPQLDPDKYDANAAKNWFEEVKNIGLSLITIGGSTVNILNTQQLLDMAVDDYDFRVIIYISSNPNFIRGKKNKVAIYWGQVPNSQNTFYGWDGLIANSFNISRNEIEPLPTIYVFDERQHMGTANWITRSNPIPREKPEISLAVAKAAEYFGVRFYIMAGGSGSLEPPPVEHISVLAKNTNLFLIPTSGINTASQAQEIFKVGADAIHIGNRLEKPGGFAILKEMAKISRSYKGRKFV